ncbi:hypothetical protein HY30_13830 [Hyphomonas chukchiensis]|uniref:Uncharacterized protein n=1 Tax=Hyphomonas chukchiensis TaxID=1280947 RepID=A0A062ULY1_9PROT|nr:hypothetical protein HY30_13830 [Hyphomonas chukchiensis]
MADGKNHCELVENRIHRAFISAPPIGIEKHGLALTARPMCQK